MWRFILILPARPIPLQPVCHVIWTYNTIDDNNLNNTDTTVLPASPFRRFQGASGWDDLAQLLQA
eukprot:4448530-Heterocapsa_arctica.AAC.1